MDWKQGQHDAPELAQTNFPEAVTPSQQYQYNQYQQQYQQYPPPKPGEGGPYSAYSGSQLDTTSPRQHGQVSPATAAGAGAGAAAGPRKRKRGGSAAFGCSVLELVLCAIIALLSAAVIGLAAGTGVEANRANTAEARAARLSSSLASATAGGGSSTASSTAASSSATSTSFASLDDNCSSNPDGVTDTEYDAFSLFGNYTFTIQCNKDAPGDPLLALFTSDLNTCMDACAAYDKYAADASNSTCGSVSFIPLWTSKSDALEGGAPGNCYLKPTQTGNLDDPDIGTECHAAILN